MADLTDLGLKSRLKALAKGGTVQAARIAAGPGLHLLVKAGAKPGTGAWVLRYTWAGKRRDMGLGGYPAVGLAEARSHAAEALRGLRAGADPLAARLAEREAREAEALAAAVRAVTFRDAALAAIAAKAPGWGSAKHAGQWKATLTTHAFPHIGATPVADIGRDEVLAVLSPIWTTLPETASRLRGRVEAVLDYAGVMGWRAGENPARWKGNLAQLLPPPRKVAPVEHFAALPWGEVPAFLAALEKREGMAAKALRFAILTAARTGEVRGATWGELDLEAAVWVIPARRMKMRRQHRVPLSRPALALLRELRPAEPEPDALVFPSPATNGPLSDMGLSMLVRGMATDGLKEGELPRWRDAEGRPPTPHGFRSSFRDWAGETRPEGREVVERALAHLVKDKAEAAYARSDLLERRRPLMEAWGEHCEKRPAEVVTLAAPRRKRA